MAVRKTPNARLAPLVKAAQDAQNERLAPQLQAEFSDGMRNTPERQYLDYLLRNWADGQWRAHEAVRIGAERLFGLALKAHGLPRPDDATLQQWTAEQGTRLAQMQQQLAAAQAQQAPGLSAPVMKPGLPLPTGP